MDGLQNDFGSGMGYRYDADSIKSTFFNSITPEFLEYKTYLFSPLLKGGSVCCYLWACSVASRKAGNANVQRMGSALQQLRKSMNYGDIAASWTPFVRKVGDYISKHSIDTVTLNGRCRRGLKVELPGLLRLEYRQMEIALHTTE